MAMKKVLFLFVAFYFFLTNLGAQDPIFIKGSKVLNLGVGLGSTLYRGSYYKTQVPPVSASFEVGILENLLEKGSIGVGGYLGFSSIKYEYLEWGWKYSNIIIGPRGNFHYPLIKKLDTYTGLLVGYNIVTSKEFGNPVEGWDYSASSGGVVWSWFVGARYYFGNKFGVMAELGYGIAYLNLGVCLNL